MVSHGSNVDVQCMGRMEPSNWSMVTRMAKMMILSYDIMIIALND